MANEKDPTPKGIDAYNALSVSDKEALNGMIMGLVFNGVNKLDQQGSIDGVSEQEIANNLTYQTMQAGQTTTELPFRPFTKKTEAFIEARRAMWAEDPTQLAQARVFYAQLKAGIEKARGITLAPDEMTQETDKMIAVDGDQYDIRAELPNIRAARLARTV